MIKTARDGTLQVAMSAIMVILAQRLDLSTEETAALIAAGMYLAPFVYRFVRKRWPWLIEQDSPGGTGAG